MTNNEFDDFDEFIEWLKDDGLKPKKSERLWRKKIFENLYNNHDVTLANYSDFKFSKKIKSLIGNKVTYQNIEQPILEIISNHKYNILKMYDCSVIKVKVEMLDLFIKNHIKVSNVD